MSKVSPVDRFIDSEELDLGIVDLVDVKLELLRHQDMQLARAK